MMVDEIIRDGVPTLAIRHAKSGAEYWLVHVPALGTVCRSKAAAAGALRIIAAALQERAEALYACARELEERDL